MSHLLDFQVISVKMFSVSSTKSISAYDLQGLSFLSNIKLNAPTISKSIQLVLRYKTIYVNLVWRK